MIVSLILSLLLTFLITNSGECTQIYLSSRTKNVYRKDCKRTDIIAKHQGTENSTEFDLQTRYLQASTILCSDSNLAITKIAEWLSQLEI
ncbi:hypothetical protein WUBG_02054 [Wuchereria bancrofti]|uniref:Uncharacterized protein n=1 Tax=Wuchereria bancrofti TaxID=6293 RepID=J9FI98_WUCBA|nr:hypothetical protein WUBG_02054 [Wuchereria bancrofti]